MTILNGKTALVTGASSGLGAAFARQLASMNANLVITARRAKNLEDLAKELQEKHGIQVTTISLDLSEASSAQRLYDETEGKGLKIDVLINNAGGGIHQDFVDIPWEQTASQIQLNVVTLTQLTWLFSRAMLKRHRGHILNISSVGAYSPSPTYATYSAGKAFVRDFSEAVAYELRKTPVRVCSLCPGLTVTEFHQQSGHANLPTFTKMTFMSADECARIGLKALFSGRRNIISGITNKISMFMLRFMARRVMVWGAAQSMGRPQKEEGSLLEP